MAEPILDVAGLTIAIDGVDVVSDLSFSVGRGEIVALVGESGSGKSLTALALMDLLPEAATRVGGRILLDGGDLTALDGRDRRRRGETMAMIFQEPIASLNPLMRIGEQVVESLILHRDMAASEARGMAIDMLRRVGIADPEQRFRQFPFELSGGMCQRVMIAAALICRPALLIADEPTTALDVTIQAQILELMKGLRRESGMAIVIITHDMGVVADIADRVCVLYGGRIVESGPVEQLFTRPSHPYSRLLLGSIPSLDGPRKVPLRIIDGTVPDFRDWPSGCRFRPRCPLADASCADTPALAPVRGEASHVAACWHLDRIGDMA